MLAPGFIAVGFLLAAILRTGLGVVEVGWAFGWAWQGLTSRLLLGGIRLDFGWVWVGLLICARCAAAFGAALGCH